MRALLFAYAISTVPSSAPNSRRDNVLQLPTKNFAKKTKLYAFAMRRVAYHALRLGLRDVPPGSRGSGTCYRWHGHKLSG